MVTGQAKIMSEPKHFAFITLYVICPDTAFYGHGNDLFKIDEITVVDISNIDILES